MDNVKSLIKEFNTVNTKESKQRVVLCNKWKMYWLLTEVLEMYYYLKRLVCNLFIGAGSILIVLIAAYIVALLIK